MAEYSIYKSLELPSSNEHYNIGVFNKNAMAIDSELHKLDLRMDEALYQSNCYTDTKIAELINGAPETLDTLKEVTDAIEEDKNDLNIAKEHAGSQHARVDATKVEKSDINGNIKINGAETNVYTLPPSAKLPLTTSLAETEEGVAALDSTVGKVLKDEIAEINNNLKGFEPVLDETGKITGYRTSIGGADTVFPFSSGKKTKTITIYAHVSDNRMNIYVNGRLICTGSTWSEASCGYTVTVD